MKNAKSFIVWTGNVYGDWDRCLDIWTDVSEAEDIGKEALYFERSDVHFIVCWWIYFIMSFFGKK